MRCLENDLAPLKFECQRTYYTKKSLTLKSYRSKMVGSLRCTTRTYEVQAAQMKKQPTTTKNVLSCDLGVDRLISCVTNSGDTFLINGKSWNPLTSISIKSLASSNKKILKMAFQNVSSRINWLSCGTNETIKSTGIFPKQSVCCLRKLKN